MSNFRVYSTDSHINGVKFYFVESTAPDTVEPRDGQAAPAPTTLVPIDDPDAAVAEIVDVLVPDSDPSADASLVVMVHGYNTPRASALEFYAKARRALAADAEVISRGRPIVFVGFRWPSEHVWSVITSSVGAMPWFPMIAASVCATLAVAICGVWVGEWASEVNWPVGRLIVATVIATLCFGIVVAIGALAILRATVYFRDIYRATNYGVPDLVEVIRQIDLQASKKIATLRRNGETARRARIALSFVGHSMGGLVVTYAIRMLSDVFDASAIRTTLSGRARAEMITRDRIDRVNGRIGHVFTLMRFVLASPDIPAEILLADRANFLASSLRRFREAYLFCSEGDEVLRLVSTAANYFWFPTLKRNFGYRLGNAEILSEEFGLIEGPCQLHCLRVGEKRLDSLAAGTRRDDEDHAGAPKQGICAGSVSKAFTFFDCTDYVEGPHRKGMLTEARNHKRKNAEGRIPTYEHLWLLWRYVDRFRPNAQINVHGGYFDGELSQRLIYRLASLGFTKGAEAFGGPAAIMKVCADRQIRVLLSPRLKLSAESREPMETPERPQPAAADTARSRSARIIQLR